MAALYLLCTLLLLSTCSQHARGAHVRGLQADAELLKSSIAAGPDRHQQMTVAKDPRDTLLQGTTAARRAEVWRAESKAQIAAAAAATCPAGQHFTNGSCRNCPLGTFRPADGDAGKCRKCLAPYSTSHTGSTSADDCVVCPPGHGTPENGANCICAPCALGTYSAGGPAELCAPCPAGLSTKTTGSTNLSYCTVKTPPPPPVVHSRCDPGQYYDTYTEGCRECPPGSFNTPDTIHDTICTQCYNQFAYSTKGYSYGAQSGQECIKCQAGYGRPLNGPSCLCMACPKGAYSTGYSPLIGQPCTPCPANYTTIHTTSTDSSACTPRAPDSLPNLEAQGKLLLQGKGILLGPGQQGSAEGMGTWSTEKYICYWAGVDCLNGLVQGVRIVGEKLVGRLPEIWAHPALAGTLQYLHIESPAAGSKLSDTTVPAAWTQLIFLEDFRLSGLNLTGPLPKRLPPNVVWLSYDNNRFTGTVPKIYTELPLLQLDLSNNQLTGQLAASLSEMLQLQYLSLGGNQFTGLLPVEWGALANLNYLILNNNSLTGSVPESWDELSSLHTLDISNNQLTQLPGPSFWALQKSLAHFFADGNLFEGALPDYLSTWVPGPSWGQRTESLYSTLSLNDNKFSGGLPKSWKAFKGDMVINLAHNQLSGPVPTEPWASVLRLDLSYNRLTGSLSESWKNWSVVFLDLRHNQVKGPLPAAWKDWNSVENQYYNRIHLFLSNNPLNCSLPREWSKWTNLQSLFVDNTGLTGSIPRSWTNFLQSGGTSLESLVVFGNPALGGCVPKQPWVQLLWGPATSDAGVGYTTGYQIYPFLDINKHPRLKNWPPFQGTNVTGLCGQ